MMFVRGEVVIKHERCRRRTTFAEYTTVVNRLMCAAPDVAPCGCIATHLMRLWAMYRCRNVLGRSEMPVKCEKLGLNFCDKGIKFLANKREFFTPFLDRRVDDWKVTVIRNGVRLSKRKRLQLRSLTMRHACQDGCCVWETPARSKNDLLTPFSQNLNADLSENHRLRFVFFFEREQALEWFPRRQLSLLHTLLRYPAPLSR